MDGFVEANSYGTFWSRKIVLRGIVFNVNMLSYCLLFPASQRLPHPQSVGSVFLWKRHSRTSGDIPVQFTTAITTALNKYIDGVYMYRTIEQPRIENCREDSVFH